MEGSDNANGQQQPVNASHGDSNSNEHHTSNDNALAQEEAYLQQQQVSLAETKKRRKE